MKQIYSLIASLVLPTQVLYSQSQLEEKKPELSEKKPEKITVTGSRIKRLDSEGTSPLTIISRDQLENSGFNSLHDVLRDFTGADAAFAGSGGFDAFGTASVSLKGLGESRTLVLIDGVRLPKHPELAAVDLNSIPLAAVEHIEILQQSASAIYGADAMGGVVNIITKKDFDGSNISVYHSQTRGKAGDSTSIQGTTGFATESTQSTLILSYDHQERIGTTDRSYTRDRQSGYGFPGSYGKYTDLTTYDSVEYPAAACSSYESGEGQISPTWECPYNYNDHNTLSPEINRFSALYNVSWEVSSHTTLDAKFMGTFQESEDVLRPELTTATISQGAIDAMSQERFDTLFPGFGGVKPDDEGVWLNLRLADFGNNLTNKDASLLGTHIGVTHSTDTIEWRFGVHGSGSRTNIASKNKIRSQALIDVIGDGTYVPWDSGRDLDQIKSLVVGDSRGREEIQTRGLEASLATDLVELPSGPLSIAAGVGASKEEYTVDYDQETKDGVFMNTVAGVGAGDRTIAYGFSEAIIPVTGDIEMNLAVRFDQYSDFGASTNPLLGAKYQLLDELLLRTSFATGFRPPSLDELYAAESSSYNFVVDYPWCEVNGISADDCADSLSDEQLYPRNIRSGNEDLKAETSQSFSFGFVTEPVQHLVLGLDYWQIEIKDQIGLVEPQNIIEENDPSVVIRNDSEEIDFFYLPRENSSESKVAGIDVAFNYQLRLAKLRIIVANNGTWFLENRKENGESVVDDYHGDMKVPRWKTSHTITAGYNDTYLFTVRNTRLAKMKNYDESGLIPDYKKTDLQFKYHAPWKGTYAIGVDNVFDVYGGYDEAFEDVDQSYYNIHGIEYYLSASQDF